MEKLAPKIINRAAALTPAATPAFTHARPLAAPHNALRSCASNGHPFIQLQSLLKVSSPKDPAEKEADATAEGIMRMAAPERSMPRPNSNGNRLSRMPEAERKQQPPHHRFESPYITRFADSGIFQRNPGKDDARVLRKAEGTPDATSSVAGGIQSSLSAGSPLPPSVRSFMEPRFQADFSEVRVHTDPEAAKLSNQLSARAFTYQNHIFFSRDQYQPDTGEGKHLLAHELTHTLQQGAVARRKLDVSKVQTPQVQRGAFDWVKDKIRKGLNWAADRLIPGYTLLNVILGQNVLTGEPVSRSGVNIIRGYMRLSPIVGSVLLAELEETSTLPEAGAWVEAQLAKFGINFNVLANRLEAMWGEMSVWQSLDGNVAVFRKYISPVLGPFLAFSSVVMGKVKELRFEGALRLVGATQLLAAMKQDPGAFKRLVDDPKVILKYFMGALKEGFSRFKDNFVTHFKNALFGWLFGKAAEMGVQMPKEFSAAGLFHLVAQLVGATFQHIRMQVVKRLGPKGESILSTMEKTVDVVKDLIKRGPIALWERVKSFLADLKEMIFSKISELVTVEIIKAAVLKLLSMLNPAGALVQLVLGIYRVVKFFIDKWETIKQLTNAILNSITQVALGNIAAAAGYIESTMAKGLTLVIGFLASIFGLGGIVDKVKALIKKISDPVQAAIGKVVGWIVEKGQQLLKKIGRAVLQAGVPQDPKERLSLAVRASVSAARTLTGRVTEALLNPILAGIKVRYGLTAIQPFESSGSWWVRAIINPEVVQDLGLPLNVPSSVPGESARGIGRIGTHGSKPPSHRTGPKIWWLESEHIIPFATGKRLWDVIGLVVPGRGGHEDRSQTTIMIYYEAARFKTDEDNRISKAFESKIMNIDAVKRMRNARLHIEAGNSEAARVEVNHILNLMFAGLTAARADAVGRTNAAIVRESIMRMEGSLLTNGERRGPPGKPEQALPYPVQVETAAKRQYENILNIATQEVEATNILR